MANKNLKLEMSEALSLEIKQVFEASIDDMWDAWTNPESLKQWKCPEGMTTPEVDVDLKVGGKYRIVMQGDGKTGVLTEPQNAVVGGEYKEIKPKTKLVYTWLWEGAPAESHTTTVTILLNKVAKNKTEVTLVHSGFADENMKREHSIGWDSTLKKLGSFLA